MKRLAMLALIGSAMLALAAVDPFAVRVKCEVDTDTTERPAELRTLRWLQGTTPLVQLDVESGGRPAFTLSTTTVARMVIGQAATGTWYAVATNYALTNGSFLVQWPTVGTNTGTSVWWYTVYFDRGGQTYWTGSGDLTIGATDSTAEDGLVWQEFTSGTALLAALAVSSRVDVIEANTSVWNGAAASASTALATANTANSTATNAIAQSIAASLAAASKVDASTVTGIVTAGISSWAPTGSVAFADQAASLHTTNAEYSITIDNGIITVAQMTNITSVAVIATNGPCPVPVGTVFSSPTWESYWAFTPFGLYHDNQNEANLFAAGTIGYNADGWNGAAYGELPRQINVAKENLLGAMTVDWLKATNTYTVGGPQTITFTNGTTMADGVLNGTNGVYFSKLGTNYWILLQ